MSSTISLEILALCLNQLLRTNAIIFWHYDISLLYFVKLTFSSKNELLIGHKVLLV